MIHHSASSIRRVPLFGVVMLVAAADWGPQPARGQITELTVDTVHSPGPIDLTRYALGQGGISDQPMITDRIEQIAQLHPQTIHVFLQEYFNIYPAHHTLFMRCSAGTHRVDLRLALPATGGVRIYGRDEGHWRPADLLPLSISRHEDLQGRAERDPHA